MDLRGKTVLVTGGAKGVGRAIVQALAEAGATIALHYHHSEKEAHETVEELRRANITLCAVKANLAHFAEVEAMKNDLDQTLGHVDMVVNNAGYTKTKSFFKYKPDEWREEVDVCLHGVMNLAYTFVPPMKERGEGKFIQVVGDSARTGDRHLIISAAARNGAISFMKSLAQEIGRDNVQCNTLSLGLIDKGDLPFKDEVRQKIMKQYPAKRLGEPSDVTGAVEFLLSPASDWITGQVLPVNGGHSMFG